MKVDLELLKEQKGQIIPMIPFFDKTGDHPAVDALEGILNMMDAIQDELEGDVIKLENQGKFPNGFSNWVETHHVIVEEITRQVEIPDSKCTLIMEMQGTGGIWELGEELTDKFEREHANTEWGFELGYLETLEKFLDVELK